MFSISISTTSPFDRNLGLGFIANATPAGVPVAMMSHGSSGYDVAWFQCHNAAEFVNNLVYIENHVARRGVLSQFAVDTSPNPQVCWVAYLVGCGYAWSKGREGVEALATRPLFVLELDVSGGNIV